jgi:hypothetical protein
MAMRKLRAAGAAGAGRRALAKSDQDPEIPEAVECGPYLADSDGVYTRERGAEQWLLIAGCILTVG